MFHENYTQCRVLPAINETFPQFSQHPKHIATVNSLILSPLDLSLRAGVGDIVPITPPSTPSPPRKRTRFMTDEHYLWRPHVMGTSSTIHNGGHEAMANNVLRSSNNGTKVTDHQNFPTAIMTYTKREELTPYASTQQRGEEGHGEKSPHHTFMEENNAAAGVKAREEDNSKHFSEIPKSQRSVMMLEGYYRQHHQPQSQLHRTATIYVDDETIVLTEDEDEHNEEDEEVNEGEEEDDDGDDDDGEDEEIDAVDLDEENETLVSSQELNEEDMESNEPHHRLGHHTTSLYGPSNSLEDKRNDSKEIHSVQEIADPEDEEEYVDILSNDDDDINPLSSKAITMLRLQSKLDLDEDLAKSHQVLTRNKLVYENEELHNRAVEGLAKLFDKDFQENTHKEKTYIDLTNCAKVSGNPYGQEQESQEIMIPPTHKPCSSQNDSTIHRNGNSSRPPPPSYKMHKPERKRMKLRKHMSLDEETISPVSGTIIRKLRDDEELVVRKGDIDPAFNVVEVTEEAKAILASIDNKIGAYLCQLCRTLYDDAFKLAQHRCPRIVHIEYKCSECEKVFNCPANLASHRRWHKPKSELLANSQAKKRQHSEQRLSVSHRHSPDKNIPDDGTDGIYPCNQCGKTFRRQAYLKKHQASHQMLENLKSLDIFKNSPNNHGPLHATNGVTHMNTPLHGPNRIPTNPLYPPMLQPRPYPSARFGTFPFGTPFDHRRFYTLGEFYLSQQLERSSAFQYVQANHLRNLSNVASGNFNATRPVVPAPIIPLPVK
ncbi:nervous fingers 2 [Haematobia irritans]|uniref:nervous fingers 2 n=1 Tax=Haematobia irritans TaxID=7368 RepID=UPI003F504DD3